MSRPPTPLARFVVWTLVVVLGSAAVTWWLAARIARAEAIDDAAHSVERLARAIAHPHVYADRDAPGYAEGLAQLDERVRSRIAEGLLLRVKVWSPDGEVLYSDEPRLMGQRFTLSSEARSVLATGSEKAEVTELDASENVLDRSLGRDADAVVEGYARFDSRDGQPLLFEAYYAVDDLLHHERELLMSLLPWMLAGPSMVAAVMFFGAVDMNRRIRHAEQESLVALRRVFDVAAHERRRVARDMHDRLIPSLAAVRLSLESIAGRSAHGRELGPLVDVLALEIERIRDDLRDLNAPSVARVGLATTLEAIAGQARAAGLEVTCTVAAPDLPDPAARMATAIVAEGLRNVRRHAAATQVDVLVEHRDGSLLVCVADDGHGPGDRPQDLVRADHGLGLLADTVVELGGEVRLEPRSPRGTRLLVEVPLDVLDERPSVPRPRQADAGDRVAGGARGRRSD